MKRYKPSDTKAGRRVKSMLDAQAGAAFIMICFCIGFGLGELVNWVKTL